MPEESATLAVVVSRIEDLSGDIKDLRAEVQVSNREKVSRGEWGQRNDHVDTRLGGLGREVGELRADLNNRRAPWWSTWAVILSAGALAWSVLGPSIRAG